MKERVTFLVNSGRRPSISSNSPGSMTAVVQSKWNDEAIRIITDYKTALRNGESSFTADIAKSTLNAVLEKHGVKIGKVMQALRLAVTGTGGGPDLMQIMEILGREETTNRIEKALNTLKES